jgi:hypothetical protein
MIIPIVSPRIKKSDHLAGFSIDACDVGSLIPIAVQAGQGEIARNVLTSVLPGDDVINLKGRWM